MSYMRQREVTRLVAEVNLLKAMVLDVMEHQGMPVKCDSWKTRITNDSKGRLQCAYYLDKHKEDSDIMNDLVSKLHNLENTLFSYVSSI